LIAAAGFSDGAPGFLRKLTVIRLIKVLISNGVEGGLVTGIH